MLENGKKKISYSTHRSQKPEGSGFRVADKQWTQTGLPHIALGGSSVETGQRCEATGEYWTRGHETGWSQNAGTQRTGKCTDKRKEIPPSALLTPRGNPDEHRTLKPRYNSPSRKIPVFHELRKMPKSLWVCSSYNRNPVPGVHLLVLINTFYWFY